MMIVLGLTLFIFGGFYFVAWCLCRAASLEPPEYEQPSHVEVLRFVDLDELMGDASA